MDDGVGKGRYHQWFAFHLYFLIMLMTTAATFKSFFGTIGLYFLFAGMSSTLLPVCFRYFIVQFPSTSAITISPLRGVMLRSTRAVSPSMMPASIIESPFTLSMYVASLLFIS